MSLLKWKELADKMKISNNLVKEFENKVIQKRLEKGASRDLYKEIFKPVTSEIKSQSEQLTEQLASLPKISQQLAALPAAIGEEVQEQKTYQGLPQLFAEEPRKPTTGDLDAKINKEVIDLIIV